MPSIKGGHMFNSGILDVVLGLIFIYLLLSLVCTAVNEWIESFLKKRSATLEQGIRELLDDQKNEDGLACELYKHPLVFSLYRGDYKPLVTKKNLPSYIPAKNFAIALMDIVLSKSTSENPMQALQQGIEYLPDGKAKGALIALGKQAGGDINKTRKNI